MFTSILPVLVHLLMCFLIYSASEEIKAKPGENVTLQCQDPRGAAIKLLKWSKPDLKSEDDVYYFRDERSYEKYQHESFRGRVQLRDPEMKNGNVSVILKNVTINDTGTYECHVGDGRKSELFNTITLTVTDSGHNKDGADKGGHVGLAVGLSVLMVVVVVVVVIGLVIFRKLKVHKDKNSYQSPAEYTGEIQMSL